MENIDPALLQQYLQNNSDSGSGSSMTPTINLFPESFIALLSLGFIILLVLSSLFLLAYILGMVRKWKVQSAILDMHKDVKELKQLMGREKPEDSIDKDTPRIA